MSVRACLTDNWTVKLQQNLQSLSEDAVVKQFCMFPTIMTVTI